MVKRVPHTVNGRFYGMWYYLADGRLIYLAHRRRKEIYRAKMAWRLDMTLLDEAKCRGAVAVGVICKSGKDTHFYLTRPSDFFDSPFSFSHWGETKQRGLPLSRFRVNPSTDRKVIAATMRLR